MYFSEIDTQTETFYYVYLSTDNSGKDTNLLLTWLDYIYSAVQVHKFSGSAVTPFQGDLSLSGSQQERYWGPPHSRTKAIIYQKGKMFILSVKL